MVMDRYLLVPSHGLGWALARRFPAERIAPRLVWVVLLVALAALSVLGMRVFRDEDTFWAAAIRADPGSSTAWTEWAKRRSEAGDLAAASDALERAILLDPRAQLPRLRRALLALRRDQPQAAVAELLVLVERNPGYLPAWRNLVVAQDRAQDGASARRSLERALLLFPHDPQLLSHRAVVLRSEGRREEALVAIRHALAQAPNDPALILREALLLVELGRREEARTAARRGLALDPAPEIRASLASLAR
jgi:Flp pilus assembly protein TadD